MPRPAASDTPPTKKRSRVKSVGGSVEQVRARGIDTSTYEACALIDEDKPLTDKQKLFVANWAHGESILSASYRAGYADGGAYAYRMVKMPNIIALYNAEKKLYEDAAQMTRKKVMDMLLESYDCAKMAGEAASMVSAAREIGKMCGYYEPVKSKIDITVNGSVIHRRMESMSDSELLEMITGGKALDVIEGNAS